MHHEKCNKEKLSIDLLNFLFMTREKSIKIFFKQISERKFVKNTVYNLQSDATQTIA